MAFIIFGFYGTGKTTFCKENPTIAKDYDSEFFPFIPNLKENFQKDLQTNLILFINRLDTIENKKVHLIFLPKNKEVLQYNLVSRNVQQEFIQEIVTNFSTIISSIKEYATMYHIPIIELDKNQYISNYKTEIIKRKENHNEH